MTRDDLNNLVHAFQFDEADLCFALNTALLSLYRGDDDKPCATFYLNPPWRIVRDGTPVMSSIDCPDDDDYDTDEEADAEFDKWCALADEVRDQTPRSIDIRVSTGDLVVRWQCGTVLEVFVSHRSNTAWWFTDYCAEHRYKVLPRHIAVGPIGEEGKPGIQTGGDDTAVLGDC